MKIEAFFDPATSSVSYVVSDPATRACAIIDPILDFDGASGRMSTVFADRIIAYIHAQDLTVAWILETHIHADHLTAAAHIKMTLGGRTGIGAQVAEVRKMFAGAFDLKAEPSPFDTLFQDGDVFAIGSVNGRVMFTPGHTPACVSYVIDDAAFVGDTLFMPDYGTARADFPGADARTLYRSIRRILSLPDGTRIFTCHDYKAPGREAFAWQSTVGEQRRTNIHVRDDIAEDAFVAMRTARDKTLTMPQLILPAIQVNLRAGALPAPDDNGVISLKLPINVL